MELELFETLLLVLHVGAALAIIGLVLIQQGRGAEMGAGFGGGASNTVFGSGGSGSFLTRMTTAIAIAFFLTSFGLAIFAKQHAVDSRNLGIPQTVPTQRAPVESEVPEPTGQAETEVPVAPGEQEIPAEGMVPETVETTEGDAGEEIPDNPE